MVREYTDVNFQASLPLGSGQTRFKNLFELSITMKDKRQMFYGASSSIFRNAEKLRANMTECERLLWEELKSNKILGLRFKAQHPVDSFIADFYCHKLKLVIEIDGEYHAENEQVKYDAGRTEEMALHGLKVLRFRNQEVNDNLKQVVEKIRVECLKMRENQ